MRAQPSLEAEAKNKERSKKLSLCVSREGIVHHHLSMALGDLTRIRKHFRRRHDEKKWRYEKCLCSKHYVV